MSGSLARRARVLAALASASLAGAGAVLAQTPPRRPAPTPALRPGEKGPELPTTAVDPTRFPRRDPARGAVRGTTYHVSPEGDDQAAGTEKAPLRTIRRALAAAASATSVGGGTAGSGVVVHAGTYLEGAEDEETALVLEHEGLSVAAAAGAKPVVKPARASVKNGLEVRASHATWVGVSFEGFASCGIALGKPGATVEDTVLAELSVTMPAGGDGIAVYLDQREARKPVVQGLLLERVTVEGAWLGFTVGSGPARDLALRDVVIHNRSTGGGDSGRDAIGVEDADNVLVDGADISGAEGDGIDLKATRVAVLQAHVHDVDRNRIKLWKGGDVVNALVHDTGADAAIVLARGAAPGSGEKPARYRLVSSTVAFHNRRSGEAAYVLTCGYDDPADAIELELAGTLFYRNAGGLALSKGTRATVTACAFVGTKGGKVADYLWDGTSSRSIEETDGVEALARLGTARANLASQVSPVLAKEDARTVEEFRLAPASPLVGAGAVANPFPRTDLVGAPRVRGGKTDVGALEGK